MSLQLTPSLMVSVSASYSRCRNANFTSSTMFSPVVDDAHP